MTFLKRLTFGARSFAAGVRLTIKSRDVRRAYFWILFALLGVSLALNVAGFWTLLKYTAIDDATSVGASIGLWLIRIAAGLFILLLAPFLSISLCNVLFPAFSEIPFLAGLRVLNPQVADELQKRSGLRLTTSVHISLKRLLVMTFVGIGCFLLALIPIFGPFLATPLQLYFGAQILGWEMLDPYFDKKETGWVQQKAIVKSHLPEVVGMGLLCAPVLSIPLIGPLFFGVLQAGAAYFVLEVLERDTSPDKPLSS